MLAFSINANVGASTALHSLAGIRASLGLVQSQVSTGLEVGSARDNAAVFAVAQGVRAGLAQFDAVSASLNDAQSLVNVAVSGVTAVSNLITNITQTLTRLADATISDAQRQTYTADLKSQVDEVQTYVNGSTYNGINLLTANGGTTTNSVVNGGYTGFSSAGDVRVLSGINGEALAVHAQNLTGGTNGTDGFLGLARLSYYAGPADSYYVYGATSGTFTYCPTGYLVDGDFYTGADNGPANQAGSALISRSSVSWQEAAAALAPVSASDSAYLAQLVLLPGYPYYTIYSQTASAGTFSVFNAAIATFSNQVNAALGSLGADAANIQAQITFVQSLSDAANTGLGNLVDADLAQSAAQLTALQAREQLATQALSIANAQPSSLLALFRRAA